MPKSLGTSDTIRLIIASEPGITAGKVVALALPLVTTTSYDPRKRLHTTINTMKNRLQLCFDSNGGLYIHPEWKPYMRVGEKK